MPILRLTIWKGFTSSSSSSNLSDTVKYRIEEGSYPKVMVSSLVSVLEVTAFMSMR